MPWPRPITTPLYFKSQDWNNAQTKFTTGRRVAPGRALVETGTRAYGDAQPSFHAQVLANRRHVVAANGFFVGDRLFRANMLTCTARVTETKGRNFRNIRIIIHL